MMGAQFCLLTTCQPNCFRPREGDERGGGEGGLARGGGGTAGGGRGHLVGSVIQ